MDLSAVLTDETNYPDTMEIEIRGEKIKLGDLRGTPQFKGFTKYSQERSKAQKDLEDRLTRVEQDKAQAEAQLQVALARSGQQVNQNANDPFAAMRGDPMFGPLVEAVDRANKKAEELENKAKLFEQAMWTNSYTQTIKDIQSRDEEFRDPSKVNELLNYAKNNGMQNLSQAHRELTRDRDIKKATEEAVKKGIEEGRKKALTEMAIVPSGRRRIVSPAPDAPKTFDEAEDAALNDPEVLAFFNNGSG